MKQCSLDENLDLDNCRLFLLATQYYGAVQRFGLYCVYLKFKHYFGLDCVYILHISST